MIIGRMVGYNKNLLKKSIFIISGGKNYVFICCIEKIYILHWMWCAYQWVAKYQLNGTVLKTHFDALMGWKCFEFHEYMLNKWLAFNILSIDTAHLLLFSMITFQFVNHFFFSFDIFILVFFKVKRWLSVFCDCLK